MKTKILSGFISVILFTVLWYGKSYYGFNIETKTNNKTVEVIYTSKGYNPSIIIINSGDTVKFINESDEKMWTASDPHPVHNDYSAFDTLTGLNHGQYYEYTFNKIGTYGFHNHLDSPHRGVVRVYDANEKEANIDKTLPTAIKERDILLAILDPNDPESVRKLFAKIKTDKKLTQNCHDIAHDLGHKAYELFGFSRALTYGDPNNPPLSDVDDLCAGGYMHGVLEEKFLHNPEIRDNPNLACSGVPIENQGGCFHGVGHGLMFAFKRQLKESINACELLNSQRMQHRCYEGVYMELFWGDTGHADGYLGRDLNNPLGVCNNASEETYGACTFYSHLGYLRTHDQDFTGAMKLCKNTPSPWEFGKRYCIKGLGLRIMKYISMDDIEKIEGLTNILTEEDEKLAYYEGISDYLIVGGVEKQLIGERCKKMKTDEIPCTKAYTKY